MSSVDIIIFCLGDQLYRLEFDAMRSSYQESMFLEHLHFHLFFFSNGVPYFGKKFNISLYSYLTISGETILCYINLATP